MEIFELTVVLRALAPLGVLAALALAVRAATNGEAGGERARILAAQEEWGRGVVHIGAVWRAGGDYAATARQLVDTLYAYDSGVVLFKPTLAADAQFRLNAVGAVSYFVGGNADYPEDQGFALRPWTQVRFENAEILVRGDSAVAMGNYFFTPAEGDEIKVEFTFGYIRGAHGSWRINVHHSSLPYEQPNY